MDRIFGGSPFKTYILETPGAKQELYLKCVQLGYFNEMQGGQDALTLVLLTPTQVGAFLLACGKLS